MRIKNPYEALVRRQWRPGERIETGPLQFGEDWPGLFIRGDDALMAYLPVVQKAGQGWELSVMDRAMLIGLADLLASVEARPEAKGASYLPAPHAIATAVTTGYNARRLLQATINAYDNETPFRTADVHPDACACLRCAMDRLRALLAMEDAEDDPHRLCNDSGE